MQDMSAPPTEASRTQPGWGFVDALAQPTTASATEGLLQNLQNMHLDSPNTTMGTENSSHTPLSAGDEPGAWDQSEIYGTHDETINLCDFHEFDKDPIGCKQRQIWLIEEHRRIIDSTAAEPPSPLSRATKLRSLYNISVKLFATVTKVERKRIYQAILHDLAKTGTPNAICWINKGSWDVVRAAAIMSGVLLNDCDDDVGEAARVQAEFYDACRSAGCLFAEICSIEDSLYLRPDNEAVQLALRELRSVVLREDVARGVVIDGGNLGSVDSDDDLLIHWGSVDMNWDGEEALEDEYTGDALKMKIAADRAMADLERRLQESGGVDMTPVELFLAQGPPEGFYYHPTYEALKYAYRAPTDENGNWIGDDAMET